MILDTLETERRYHLIYADPPWPQKRGNSKKVRSKSSGGELPYHTMSLTDIEAYQRRIALLEEDKCNVFLWAIDRFLPEAERMMKNLGYTLHARMIWDKVIGIPTAFTVRYAHEYLLWFYRKGYMYPMAQEQRGKWSDVFRERRTVHSKKPQIAYEMLETMFPEAKKLEVYARTERHGWDCFGDEMI